MIDLIELINSNIKVKAAKSKKKLYVSRFGLCHIRSILQLDDNVIKREVTSPNRERKFKLGKHIENDLKEAFENSGILKEHNTKLSEVISDAVGEEIGAEADFLISVDNKNYVVECKGTHPNILRYSKNLPNSYNMLQCKTYCYGYELKNIKVQGGYVVYFPMGGEVTPLSFYFKYNERIKEEVLNEIESLKRAKALYKSEGKLPNPPIGKLKLKKREKVIIRERYFECENCEFVNLSCWPAKEELISRFAKDNLYLKEGLTEDEKDFIEKSLCK